MPIQNAAMQRLGKFSEGPYAITGMLMYMMPLPRSISLSGRR